MNSMLTNATGTLLERAQRGETDAVAELYAADAILVPPDAPPASGLEAIAAYWRANWNASRGEYVVLEQRLAPVNEVGDGTLSIELVAVLTRLRGRDGREHRCTGRALFVWRHEGSRSRKLLRDMWA